MWSVSGNILVQYSKIQFKEENPTANKSKAMLCCYSWCSQENPRKKLALRLERTTWRDEGTCSRQTTLKNVKGTTLSLNFFNQDALEFIRNHSTANKERVLQLRKQNRNQMLPNWGIDSSGSFWMFSRWCWGLELPICFSQELHPLLLQASGSATGQWGDVDWPACQTSALALCRWHCFRQKFCQ